MANHSWLWLRGSREGVARRLMAIEKAYVGHFVSDVSEQNETIAEGIALFCVVAASQKKASTEAATAYSAAKAAEKNKNNNQHLCVSSILRST